MARLAEFVLGAFTEFLLADGSKATNNVSVWEKATLSQPAVYAPANISSHYSAEANHK